MAKKKGIFGALGNLFRWIIWGLAALLAVALYLNFTKDDPVTPGGEVVAALPEETTEAPGAVEEPTQEADASAEEGAEAEAETPVEGETTEDDATEEATTDEDNAPEQAASDEPTVLPETITIPGDDATYAIINAFRHDDGAIEITSSRTADGASETTIHLIRCAPLEVGVIASGDSERNDAPEMERIPLGNAVATLAATACGAMK